MKERSSAQAMAFTSGREAAGMTLACWHLAAVTTSPARARAAAREYLAGLEGWSPDADVVVLVVSELVTNAVQHAGRGPFAIDLSLELRGDRLRIAVEDHDHRPPVMVEADGHGERGRGLRMVDCLATRWGWEPVAGNGKRVWCELAR